MSIDLGNSNIARLYLLREGSDSIVDLDKAEHEEERKKSEEELFCRYCGQQITSVRLAVEVDGKHSRTFFNPAGIIYEIRCFEDAKGCLKRGPAFSEFAWFADHTWRVAICSSCTVHLGWYFGLADSGFYGLIAKTLRS